MNMMKLTKKIKVENTERIRLDIDKPTYYQGNISSDQPFMMVNVLDTNKKIIKHFLSHGENESEIFWFIETAGRYDIEIINNHHHTNSSIPNVELSLTSLKLKKEQYLSPKTKILSPLIQQVAKRIKQKIHSAENDFWKIISKNGTPLIEAHDENNVLVTFLFKGDVSNVKVLGTPYEGHTHLTRLSDSNIWYKSFIVPNHARFSYRIAPNIPQLETKHQIEQRRAVLATVQPDPLNLGFLFSESDSLFGSASTLTLKETENDQYVQNKQAPKGTVKAFSHTMNLLTNNQFPFTRKICIYHPNKKYPIVKESPMIILFDGDTYLTKSPTPTILDNLIAEGIIPPTRAVFINNPLPSMREQELTPNNAFSDYMANELMPWLADQHELSPPASNTIISGSSFGGLAAMHIAFQHPEKFGKVLSQSGSFWWSPKGSEPFTEDCEENWFAQEIKMQPRKEITIYLNAGLFERQPASHDILKANQQLRCSLELKGYKVSYEELASGHDHFSWRTALSNGLIALLGETK